MNKLFLVYAFTASSVIYAGDHEVSLNISEIKGRNFSMTTPWGSQFSTNPKDAVSLGLRFGFSLAEFDSTKLIAQATIHSEYTTEYHLTEYGQYYFRDGNGKYKNEGMSIGLNARWEKFFEYGVGTEIRYEHLSLTNSYSTKVGQYRPWINFYLGRTFYGQSYKPVFGIEVATPLIHSSASNANYINNGGTQSLDPQDFLKIISPKFEINLVIGIRK